MDKNEPKKQPRLIAPVILITIGVLFLLKNLIPSFDSNWWAILLIVIGVVMIIPQFNRN